jgi:hypothetical protein
MSIREPLKNAKYGVPVVKNAEPPHWLGFGKKPNDDEKKRSSPAAISLCHDKHIENPMHLCASMRASFNYTHVLAWHNIDIHI